MARIANELGPIEGGVDRQHSGVMRSDLDFYLITKHTQKVLVPEIEDDVT